MTTESTGDGRERGHPRVVAGVAAVGVLFGVATLVAGGRVLTGADPGYRVFRPLLVFNTIMGGAYVVAGVAAWVRPRTGLVLAGLVAGLNVLVLLTVATLFVTSDLTAGQSVGAMALRAGVWVGIYALLRRTLP